MLALLSPMRVKCKMRGMLHAYPPIQLMEAEHLASQVGKWRLQEGRGSSLGSHVLYSYSMTVTCTH